MTMNEIEIAPQSILEPQGIKNEEKMEIETLMDRLNSVILDNRQLIEDNRLMWEMIKGLSRRIELIENKNGVNLSSPSFDITPDKLHKVDTDMLECLKYLESGNKMYVKNVRKIGIFRDHFEQYKRLIQKIGELDGYTADQSMNGRWYAKKIR